MLVASSLVFLGLLLYLMFANYLPTKQRVLRLERELREVYAREVSLQARLAQRDQRTTFRDQQLTALRAERDALARRIGELERELGRR
jgi:hypothetical protein